MSGRRPDFQKLINARAFACQRHGAQQYGSLPYAVHLKMVAQNVMAYGQEIYSDTDLVSLASAAWLHDIVEDTPTSIDELEFFFGKRIATLVHLVSDPNGRSRAEKKSGVYKKLQKAGDGDAVFLKLCDRIANIHFSLFTKNLTMLVQYRTEQRLFRKQLGHLGPLALWEYIDALLSGLKSPSRESLSSLMNPNPSAS
jgi:guanosine-3',5'-bis(diphosphate) 3'-pyrophosphohydrolase